MISDSRLCHFTLIPTTHFSHPREGQKNKLFLPCWEKGFRVEEEKGLNSVVLEKRSKVWVMTFF